MQPPWIQFPDLPHGSIGWRMGNGEDYYNRFYRWFSSLSVDEQVRVQTAEPEPESWRGFYDMIAQHPWRPD